MPLMCRSVKGLSQGPFTRQNWMYRLSNQLTFNINSELRNLHQKFKSLKMAYWPIEETANEKLELGSIRSICIR